VGGGEYISLEFNNVFRINGIVKHLTINYDGVSFIKKHLTLQENALVYDAIIC